MPTRRAVAILTLMALLLPLVNLSGLAAGTSRADLLYHASRVADLGPDEVQAQGDTLVVDNAYRRIEFTADGMRFAPRKNGVLVPGHEVTYRLIGVRPGEEEPLAAAMPTTPEARENVVDYDHPVGLVERYVVDEQGVEQLFVVDEPLSPDGDLEIVGQFQTALTAELVDPTKGVRFHDGEVDVLTYSGALVFDAAGRQAPAPLRLDGEQVTISVPAEWLAGATYPVTIDPRLEGGIINVGYLSLDQDNPAVAYSTLSGQYLVVFESSSNNGNILGQFVDAKTGALLGSYFYIANSTSSENNPDVAYDPGNDRFLVVYDDGNVGSRNVVGLLVYGSHQSSGNQIPSFLPTMIAGGAADEYDPAVAYNAADQQFAVVYLRDNYVVYGRMVGAGNTYPNPLGTGGFEIWNHGSSYAHDPDVAWASGGNTFLAAWHRQRPDAEVEPDYIAVAYLYDTYQGGGSQVYGTWRMAPYDSGSDPLANDCASPAVAYDPVADAYVVVFQHKYMTASYAIHGQRLRSQYDSGTFRYDADYAFPIETSIPSFSGHVQPDISFSGTSNEMHVVYTSYWTSPSSYWVHDRTLHGTNVGLRLEVRHAGGDAIEQPAVSGSSNGRCLVVWREAYTPEDWDIFGQRVSPYRVFLPITRRAN